MKKKVSLLIIVFISFIYLLIASNINGESLTGEAITGEASAQSTNVSIQVIRPVPFLSILNPENKTYLNNKSILLNFTTIDEETAWYNFDNTANTTITSSTLFNISQGSHTLYMFANNTEGNETAKNITFSVNSTKFITIYNEYVGLRKGSSTDFNSSTYEDIQNLSEIILEHTIYGKIQFNEAINRTDDLNSSDRLLDLDISTNFSINRIELNSTALPNFDKPATLYLYNLAFNNPRILKNGNVCGSSVCIQNSYSGGTLSFNITEFSVYSAEETPTGTGTVTTGGGGGGKRVLITKIITIDPEEIRTSLKQGQTITKDIIIKNEENKKVSVKIKNTQLEEFIKISEKEFTLDPLETKIITIDILAKEDAVPNLYIGNLIFEADKTEEKVLVVIEVESKEALFDVRLNIPEKYLKVYPGENLNSEIEIFNIVDTGKVNVAIEYLIKDEQNKEIVFKSEFLLVDGAVNFTKIIKIPENVEPGNYVIYARVIYNEKVASASAWFSVKKRFDLKQAQTYVIISLVILITFIILNKFRKIKKHKKSFYKADENLLAKKRLIKRK